MTLHINVAWREDGRGRDENGHEWCHQCGCNDALAFIGALGIEIEGVPTETGVKLTGETALDYLRAADLV